MGAVVGGMTGGGATKPVTTKAPVKTAMTANIQREQKNPVSANMQDRRRQTSARSTVMTGGKGLTEPAKTQKKELLGS